MASIPGLAADVYFGDAETPLPDWRAVRKAAGPVDDDDDDEASPEDQAAVAGMAGLDPRELFEEKQGGQMGHARLAPPKKPSAAKKPAAAKTPAVWQPYVGKMGKRKGAQGWKNATTGRVVWVAKPGAPRAAQATAEPAGPRHTRATVDEAHAHIQGLLADPAKLTQDSIRQTAEHLLSMSVKDLQGLKAKLGLKGSGTKAQLVQKIAEGALRRGPGCTLSS